MADGLTLQTWIAAAEIVAINLLLSGDNAVVIALACRGLPPRQRRAGIFWGVLGAVLLRILLTGSAATLMTQPYLKLGGAVLLLWIAVKLMAEDPAAQHDVKASERLWTAVWTVIVADAVMSLDNVIGVAGAARGSLWLLGFGLAVSIPIVVAGSQLVMRLIDRFPLLVIAGGGLLGYIAGEMAADDPAATALRTAQPWFEPAAPLAGLLLVIAASVALTRRAAPRR